MSNIHTITRRIVSGNGASVFRCQCSCGLTADAPRLSTAARRRQDRVIAEHLAAVGQPEAEQGAVA